MALLGYSDDFDLDDDGILRETGGSSGLFLDEDGIIRDDTDIYNPATQWTDSGLGGDKRSSTSTLRHFEFPASFEEEPNLLDERSLNISELEASRDFTLDTSYLSADGSDLNLRDSKSFTNFNQTLKFQDTDNLEITGSDHVELFNEEYYRQLKDLGVLVDGDELSAQRQSLVEFESLEADLIDARQLSDGDPIAQYLKPTDRKNISYLTGDSFQLNSECFPSQDDRALSGDLLYNDRKSETDYLENSRPGSRARSDRTVSSRSFPEVSPEEALDLYMRSTSQQDTRETPSSDDNGEIQLVDNDAESIEFGDSPKDQGELTQSSPEVSRPQTPSKIPQYTGRATRTTPSPVLPKTPNRERQDGYSSSRSITPVSRDRRSPGQSHDYRRRAITPDSSETASQPGSDSRSEQRSGRRKDSGSSQFSTASEIVPRSPDVSGSRQRPTSQKALGKARSQESFFDKSLSGEKDEKQPKRVLPKPNMTADQSFKVKCKSTTNISSKPGPVKPTHMSLAEITNITIDDSEDVQSEAAHSTTSEKSKGELKAKLNQESSQRKQATELVHQLQKDYDNLLSKYALAELTIDQLRLGAKITLHSDSPTPNQAYSGTLTPSQQPQVSTMMAASRGLITSSPAPGMSGRFSPVPLNDAGDIGEPRLTATGGFQTDETEGAPGDGRGSALGEAPASLLTSAGSGNVKVTLEAQTRRLNEQTETFRRLLDHNQLSVEQQETVFDKLRSEHDKLRRDYLQAKEDNDILRRTSGTDPGFDENKELEGELFRLGMKFDDIHERVDNNVKLRSSQRLPFQSSRSRAATPDITEEKSVDQLKHKLPNPNAGYNLVKPTPNRVFDDKLRRLHDEYNKLMQLYRKVKQQGQISNKEQAIDNLVQKLWEICEEAPDVFKLPREIQERLDALNRSTSEYSPLDSPSPAPGRQSESSESLTRDRESPGSVRLSQLDATPQRDLAITHADRRKLDDIRIGRFSPHGSDRGSVNSAGARPRNSGGVASPVQPRHGATRGRPGKSSPFGGSAQGLKKNLESGSMSSLPDSGISEHSGMKGSLTSTQKLLSQGREFDTDSGFIGSVANYGSGRQPNLLLRHSGRLDDDRLEDEEGAVGGRTSPPLGSLQENARLRQGSQDQVDQSQIYGELTESESDFDVRQSRHRPDNKRRSSLVKQNQDLRDGNLSGSNEQLSQGSRRRNNSGLSMTEQSAPKTPQRKQKPQIYYSEDSESEEAVADIMPRSQQGELPRSHKGERSRSQKMSESESSELPAFDVDSVNKQSRLKERRSSGGHARSSKRPDSRQGSISVDSLDLERALDQPLRPGSAGFGPTTHQRKGSSSGSRRDSKDSIQRSGSSAEFLPQSSNLTRSRTGSVQDEKLKVRRYSKDKVHRRESEDSAPNQDSTFTVEDDSDASVLPFKGQLRSRSKANDLNGSEKMDKGKDHGSDSSQKVHSNSSRLKALQKEIERLKNDVKKVNDGDAANATTTAPSQQPRLRYDPENPFGFMEGQDMPYPRRRANSFSGSPARQYDDWVMFQQPITKQQTGQQQREPSGLGTKTKPSQIKGRPSGERSRRSRRPFSAGVAEINDRNRTHVEDDTTTEDDTHDGIYHRHRNGYRNSRRHSEGAARYELSASSRPYRLLANGGRVYPARASSSEDLTECYEEEELAYTQPQYFVPSGHIYYPTGTDADNVQYIAHPMRASSPYRPHPGTSAVPLAEYQYVEPTPDYPAPMYGLQAAMCPHCGRTAYHTHGEYVFPSQPVEDAEMTTSPDYLQLGRGRSPRRSSLRRTRSLSRQRHYTPDRDPDKHRYFVREFATHRSDSVESRPRRMRSRSASRSQSRSRSKSRNGRRYRRSRSNSVVMFDGSDTDSTLSGGYGPSLDDSLHVASRTARDIDHLTRKMMSTVKGEISRHSRSRERRSRSTKYW